MNVFGSRLIGERMSEFDYSDSVTIKITKVRYGGEPSTWQLDIEGQGLDGSGGTAPSFDSIFDMTYSIIHGGDKSSGLEVNEWVRFDANAKFSGDSNNGS